MKFDNLVEKIKKSYEQGVTAEEAERLAGEFLYASVKLGEELRKVDLDARMKKSGLKAIKAAVYLEAVSGSDKKPTEAMLTAIIDTHDLVQKEQDGLDKAEVERDEIKNLMSVFHEGHVHFRGIAKGTFGG